jgi:hypothetical protein
MKGADWVNLSGIAADCPIKQIDINGLRDFLKGVVRAPDVESAQADTGC